LQKKLKKKIEEACGLKELAWKARQDKANQILASTEWKQQICNELIGLSFRELEQVLAGIASERQKKEKNCEKKLKATRHVRSLSEILAQACSSRVVQRMALQIKPTYLNLRGTESSNEILPDSPNGDSSTEK